MDGAGTWCVMWNVTEGGGRLRILRVRLKGSVGGVVLLAGLVVERLVGTVFLSRRPCVCGSVLCWLKLFLF